MSLVRLPALQGFHMLHELNGIIIELSGLWKRSNIKTAPFVLAVLEFCSSVLFWKPHFNGVTSFAQNMGVTGHLTKHLFFFFFCSCRNFLPLLKFKIVQSQLATTWPWKTLLMNIIRHKCRATCVYNYPSYELICAVLTFQTRSLGYHNFRKINLFFPFKSWWKS